MSGGASFLLALLPPPELAGRIVRWRERHGIRDAAAVPHITVKARSGLDPSLEWVAAAQQAVLSHPQVQFGFGTARLFPRQQALYLPVTGSGPLALHLALLDAIQPDQRFGYEGPHLQPHLSLALARRGLDLAALLPEVQQELEDPSTRPLYTTHAVALMCKPGPGQPYAVQDLWPLAGG